MSTASSRYSADSRYSERFLVAPTQPLPTLVPEQKRPFVVAHAARRVKRPQVVARSKQTGRLIPVWLVVFALLNVGDVLSTYMGLQSGMREGNPLMSLLLAHYGFVSLIGYKLLVVLAVSGGVLLLRSFQLSVARVTIGICNVLVLLVVLLNLAQWMIS